MTACVVCLEPQTSRQALPECCPEVRTIPRALFASVPLLVGELKLARVAALRYTAPTRRPANLAPPCACFSAQDVPDPSPEPVAASTCSTPLPAAGIARRSDPDPPGVPPLLFARFQPRSHGQSSAIEFVGSPSSVLSSSGDLRPPETRTCLVFDDFTAADGSSAARSRQPPWRLISTVCP